jgi:hypothetical protein
MSKHKEQLYDSKVNLLYLFVAIITASIQLAVVVYAHEHGF